MITPPTLIFYLCILIITIIVGKFIFKDDWNNDEFIVAIIACAYIFIYLLIYLIINFAPK